MIRVVIDTNVLVSGLLTEHGAESSVLDLVIKGDLAWCVSEATLAEYDDVLNRPKFQRIEKRKIVQTLALARKGPMASAIGPVTYSSHDPDNRFLECAESANAQFLVTGNKRHFPAQWKDTKVVNARELLAALKK